MQWLTIQRRISFQSRAPVNGDRCFIGGATALAAIARPLKSGNWREIFLLGIAITLSSFCASFSCCCGRQVHRPRSHATRGVFFLDPTAGAAERPPRLAWGGGGDGGGAGAQLAALSFESLEGFWHGTAVPVSNVTFLSSNATLQSLNECNCW